MSTETQIGNQSKDTEVKPVRVVGIDPVLAFLEQRSEMSLDDLPDKYVGTPKSDLPELDEPPCDRRLHNSKVIKYQRNIGDANPQYAYFWLAPWELKSEKFAGCIPVTVGGRGSENCPTRHFNQHGLIQRGEVTLCVCKRSFRDSLKQAGRDNVEARLTRYADKSEGTEASSSNAQSPVSTTKFDSSFVDPDDLPTEQKKGFPMKGKEK